MDRNQGTLLGAKVVVLCALLITGCGDSTSGGSSGSRPRNARPVEDSVPSTGSSSTSAASRRTQGSGVTLGPDGSISATTRVGGGRVTSEVKPPTIGQVVSGNTAPQTRVTVASGSGRSVTVEESAPTNGEMFADLIVNGDIDTRNRKRVIVSDGNGRKTDLSKAYQTGKAIGQLFQ